MCSRAALGSVEVFALGREGVTNFLILESIQMKRRTKVILSILCVVLVALISVGIYTYKLMYPSAPKLKDNVLRVACIGDSITQGAGIKDAEHNSYPAQLQTLLGNQYQVINYGLRARSLQKDATMSYTKEQFYVISQESRPDVVLIMLGTNDTVPINWNAASYEKELEEFVVLYQELDSSPTVYLLRCPPIYVTKISDTSHRNDVLTDEVLPIIDRVAEKTGVQTIDIYSALIGHEDLFPDDLHPNKEGAGIIAKTVFNVIKSS